jgi:hypothetical protein
MFLSLESDVPHKISNPHLRTDPHRLFRHRIIVDSPAPVSLSLPQYPSTDEIRMETLTVSAVSAVGRSRVPIKHELQFSRKKIRQKKYINTKY